MKPVKMRKGFDDILPIRDSPLVRDTSKYFYYKYLMDWTSIELSKGVNTYCKYVGLL